MKCAWCTATHWLGENWSSNSVVFYSLCVFDKGGDTPSKAIPLFHFVTCGFGYKFEWITTFSISVKLRRDNFNSNGGDFLFLFELFLYYKSIVYDATSISFYYSILFEPIWACTSRNIETNTRAGIKTHKVPHDWMPLFTIIRSIFLCLRSRYFWTNTKLNETRTVNLHIVQNRLIHKLILAFIVRRIWSIIV